MPAQTVEEIRHLPLHSVKVNPHQPRRVFDPESLGELARSIEVVGLIHPPVVRPMEDGTYELISGERRLRACQMLGRRKIPALIRVTPTEHSAQAALIENVQRVDLNPIEIAEALEQLSTQFHYSQEELAEKVGKKRSTIANFLRLLTLPLVVRRAVAQGKFSMGHAKVVLSVEGEERQEQLYRHIVDNGLSVRQAEVFAAKKRTEKMPVRRDVHLEELEDRLRSHFGTHVAISGTAQRGRLSLDYYSLDDLHHLLDKLGIGEIG